MPIDIGSIKEWHWLTQSYEPERFIRVCCELHITNSFQHLDKQIVYLLYMLETQKKCPLTLRFVRGRIGWQGGG